MSLICPILTSLDETTSISFGVKLSSLAIKVDSRLAVVTSPRSFNHFYQKKARLHKYFLFKAHIAYVKFNDN